MEKLQNVLSNGINKENKPQTSRETEGADTGFGQVFADAATPPRGEKTPKGQDETSDRGKKLPTNHKKEISIERKKEEESDDSDKPIESKNLGSGENNAEANELASIPMGASINIITTNIQSVDDNSLIDYAKKEGIDLRLIQKILSQRQVTTELVKPGAKDFSKTEDEKIFSISEIKSALGKETNNVIQQEKSNLYILPSNAKTPGNPAKEVALNKLDDSSSDFNKSIVASVSIKMKHAGRGILMRVKEGEITGKVMSMESISVHAKGGLSGLLAKLGLDLSKDSRGNQFLPDNSQLIEESLVGSGPTSSGKFESVLSATGELLKSDDTHRKSEQFQLLSQKMGEALGQRLTAQIAKGVWQVQIALSPEQLGRIDIQLGVNGNEIEAVFKAGNVLTRDLIAEGFPRLKDVLEQSGMEVANLLLDGREGGKNDEKSSHSNDSEGDDDRSISSSDQIENKELLVSTVSDDNVDILV